MPKPRDYLPLSPTTLQVLVALAERDRHGYAILKAVERQTAGAIRLGPGTLYAAIRRLEDGALIEESSWRPEQDLDDERRRYYRLTSLGREVLRAEADRLDAAVKVARRFLADARRPS